MRVGTPSGSRPTTCRPPSAAARVTLAEVNPRVPRTFGDTTVHAAQVAEVVLDDRPLIELDQRAITDEDRAIAAHVAALIPDGATLQVGVGGTPDAVLAELRGPSGTSASTPAWPATPWSTWSRRA